jgi:RNA polymerase sigma factor (sigma-70 family)
MRAHLVEMTDAGLVAAAQDGDRDAVGVLYARHAADLVRYLRSVVRSSYGGATTAEDIAQNTWEELLSGGLAKFADRGPDGPGFGRWLRGMARYQALRHFRRHGKESAVDDTFWQYAEVAAPPLLEPVDRQREAMRERLSTEVADLPPVQRQVAALRLSGLRPMEIIAQTGWSKSKVDSTWHIAQRTLKRRASGAPRRRCTPAQYAVIQKMVAARTGTVAEAA